jgi:actin-related protein 9
LTTKRQAQLEQGQIRKVTNPGIDYLRTEEARSTRAAMSATLGKWKEEQILIICPGSQTTMAQLGCGELTPPALRIPTRMFQDEETGEWMANHVEKRRRATANGNGAGSGTDEWEYIEDPDSTEGATYPIQGAHHF